MDSIDPETQLTSDPLKTIINDIDRIRLTPSDYDLKQYQINNDVYLRIDVREEPSSTQIVIEILLRQPKNTNQPIVTQNEILKKTAKNQEPRLDDPEANQSMLDNLTTASEVSEISAIACFLRGVIVSKYGEEKLNDSPNGTSHPTSFICMAKVDSDGTLTSNESDEKIGSGEPPFNHPTYIFATYIQPTNFIS